MPVCSGFPMLAAITRPLRRSPLVVVALSALAAATLTAIPQPAAGLAPSHSVRLKPGVTLDRYDLAGPAKVFVITDTIGSSDPATIDVGAAASTLHAVAATSAIAHSHQAFAAVNGDFGAFVKRPMHAFLHDGELWQSGIQVNQNFAMTAANPYGANTPTAYLGKPTLRVQVLASATTIGVDHWNSGQPGSTDQVVGFTTRGGTIEAPRNSDCKVHLSRVGTGSEWAAGKDGVRVTYAVDEVRTCGQAMAVGNEGVVLASMPGGTGSTELASLTNGESVIVKWSHGWPGVLDSVGGRPVLVENGASAGGGPNGTFACGPTNPICDPQPRTAVAVTQPCLVAQTGCQVMLVVVDGRQPGWSTGLSLDQLVAFLIDDLGVYAALNLDGGGSSTMWIKKRPASGASRWWCQTQLSSGCLADRPYTTAGQRPVPSALMLLPGPDPNDPSPTGP
jgi:hypothetical protein